MSKESAEVSKLEIKKIIENSGNDEVVIFRATWDNSIQSRAKPKSSFL